MRKRTIFGLITLLMLLLVSCGSNAEQRELRLVRTIIWEPVEYYRIIGNYDGQEVSGFAGKEISLDINVGVSVEIFEFVTLETGIDMSDATIQIGGTKEIINANDLAIFYYQPHFDVYQVIENGRVTDEVEVLKGTEFIVEIYDSDGNLKDRSILPKPEIPTPKSSSSEPSSSESSSSESSSSEPSSSESSSSESSSSESSSSESSSSESSSSKSSSSEPEVLNRTWVNSLDYFNNENGILHEFVTGENYKDNSGKPHKYYMSMKCAAGPVWQSYRVDGKYNKLSGAVVLNFDFRNTKLEGYAIIYCDGEERYTSDIVSNGAELQPIDLDVTGVNEIKFEFVVTNSEGSVRETEYFFAIVDCYLI